MGLPGSGNTPAVLMAGYCAEENPMGTDWYVNTRLI